MYILEITYKGNNIGDQITLDNIKEYIPTLIFENSFSQITKRTKQCWVVLRVSIPLINEIKDSLPLCVVEITELKKGKQSMNVSDFL